MPGLNPDNQQPAYLIGRAWALLCQLDIDASGRQGNEAYSELWERHHATTIGEPLVAIRLIGQYRPALLAKLRTRDLGAAERYAIALDDLTGRIDPDLPPMKGSTADRSLFDVGFHHQRGRLAGVVETAEEMAERYGYASAAAVRTEISRLGLESRGRDPETGAKLWSLADFARKRAAKPGRGVGGGRPRKAEPTG